MGFVDLNELQRLFFAIGHGWDCNKCDSVLWLLEFFIVFGIQNLWCEPFGLIELLTVCEVGKWDSSWEIHLGYINLESIQQLIG